MSDKRINDETKAAILISILVSIFGIVIWIYSGWVIGLMYFVGILFGIVIGFLAFIEEDK